MEKRQVNPWSWQDAFGFSQAWRVDAVSALVVVFGQGALSADGAVVGEGDFERQTCQVFDNLGAVLEQAGGGLESIVKLNVYLTDIANLREFGRIKADYVKGPQPASTAVGVTALALPEMMIEVEAIAVV
jgi:enamine deaminase RidA (YjgF/YER057c/UK114 family)